MFSIEALEERLQQLIDQFEYEAALKFCQRILENDPNHLQTLETAGYLHTELNQPDLAVQVPLITMNYTECLSHKSM
jgi:tetratricopeptide (TPR) repeat protein